MKHIKLIITAVTVALGATIAVAETPADSMSTPETVRPVTSTYMLETGSAHIADTYLTPLKYDGMHIGMSVSRLKAMCFNPDRYTGQITGRLLLDEARNPARNATMWHIDLALGYNILRKINLPGDIRLLPGIGVGVNGGALYLARNGNNPVAAKAAATLNLTAIIAKRLTFGKINIDLSYQPTLPVTGAFFSPDYGELYYEIYLGNHKGLVHAAWPGNYFKLDNLVSADIHLGDSALRIGYSGIIFSSKANNIVTRHITHSVVIGITTNLLSIPRYSPSSKQSPRIVFAL